MSKRVRRVRTLLAAGLLVLAGAAGAQTFPSHPVKIIVPWAAGGSSDAIYRVLADALAAQLGQPVVVDNRPGAGGNIGAVTAARSPADGYTLFNCSIASHGISPAIYKSLPFDPVKDFTPISKVSSVPNALVVNPALPVKTFAEFVAWAKAGGGKLTYASTGVGSSPTMTMELLKIAAGISLEAVAYKGLAPAINDVMAGHVPVMFASVADPVAVRSGRTRPIAVSSLKRHPILPDVPTIDESGLPGFEVLSWNHLCAPTGVPAAVLERLNGAVVKALATPEARRKLEEMGVIVESSSPAELAAFIDGELAKWRKVAREAGISLDN